MYQKIKERIDYLKQVIANKKDATQTMTEGSLNIHTINSVDYYYLYDNGRRKHIDKNEGALIKQLCQQDYDKKVMKAAEEELKQLQKVYHRFHDKNCDSIYDFMANARKKIITPIKLPEDEFVKGWQDVKYERKVFSENMPEFYTAKKERVRSKSEIIIANTLADMGVPYRYEYPIFLKGMGKIHPDFTVLNVKKRKEYYMEHMGRMDDSEYVERNMKRISCYEKNGIFPGEKLILTFETSTSPLNQKILETLIEHYFLCD